MINVSIEELAKAFGIPNWPEEPINDHQRMAIRVITDFHRGKSPNAALSEATYWIKRAYDAGQSAGVALERTRWERKISKMFDLPRAFPATPVHDSVRAQAWSNCRYGCSCHLAGRACADCISAPVGGHSCAVKSAAPEAR